MSCFKKKSRQGGFTLVEVIVVAVIVAAMAAVAVPLYLGYVETSRKNAAANAAGSIASFCGACVNAGGTLTPEEGAATGQIICSNNTSIQVPLDITITLVAGDPEAEPPVPRGVKGVHKELTGDDNTVTYNY